MGLPKPNKRIVVGFSGGVTSAWCAGWAVENFERREVVLLFHDTKEEDPDTYRFLREMADALRMPITERSDGRSVTDLFYDENALANDRMAFCSRIMKAEQFQKYAKELRAAGIEQIIKVIGFTEKEPLRIQLHYVAARRDGASARFPLVEHHVTKDDAARWCLSKGVRLPRMYKWSDHANCPGCVRGGRAYWLAVKENAPEVFEQRAELEAEFGHSFLNGITLRDLAVRGLKRRVKRRESIDVGLCECGG